MIERAGELQIAQITIAISFNTSYTDMQPYITKLAGLIAHELDVNTSQVRKWSSKCRKYWCLVIALSIIY